MEYWNSRPLSTFKSLDRFFFEPATYTIKSSSLILLCSVFFATALNTAFFHKVLEIYPLSGSNFLFLLSLYAILICLTAFLLNLLCLPFTTKPVLVSLFIVCSLSNYFMGTYGILMDVEMLTNIFDTSLTESLDLANPSLLLHLILFGIVPSLLTIRVRIDYGAIRRNLLSRFLLSLGTLTFMAVAIFASAATFASFFREHKPIRYYTNPIALIYSVAKLAKGEEIASNKPLIAVGRDAAIAPATHRPKLVIFVVGETARADRFSLNGYDRETNPLLSKENLVSLENVMSSGTSTSTSVPCMFSSMPARGFNIKKALHTENLLDILNAVGVSVLWRDNNSDSKGVATRITYEDYKDEFTNPPIDGEPRDEGMLLGLQEYIDEQEGDVFIVLHQMGSHGPAYYKRYPNCFEIFTPVRKSSQLEQSSKEEIDNAYDNTILYTDYFLSKVIELLKRNDADRQAAMLYFSDHGESLGENNLYLHGYPYAFAPIEQKHVPAILWFGQNFPIDKEAIKARKSEPFSHDNIFHTVLGLFEANTKVRNADLDLIASSNAYLPALDRETTRLLARARISQID